MRLDITVNDKVYGVNIDYVIESDSFLDFDTFIELDIYDYWEAKTVGYGENIIHSSELDGEVNINEAIVKIIKEWEDCGC